MSTTATPAPPQAEPKRQSKIPAVNPYLVQNVQCSNPKCGKVLSDPVPSKNPRTQEPSMKFYCDACNYDFHLARIHAQGECVPHNLEQLNVPEVFQKGK